MTAQTDPVFDSELIRRFDVSGPRYTSYPTADRFVDTFGLPQLHEQLGKRTEGDHPLSLYFHIPFCNTVCYYCGCNKIITKNHRHSAKYLQYLDKEMELALHHLTGDRLVSQLHLGGGTPTFLSPSEMRQLMDSVRSHFTLVPDGEYSIEIDPREVGIDMVELLAELGFNRMSVGVQDFNPAVQEAVNRVQPIEETRRVMTAGRDNGFSSINMDLIYGLPLQNVASFDATVDTVLELSPDRVSLYNYAHLPRLFKPQRHMNADDLPTADTKLQILQMVIRRLTESGYVYIGMDHFAKPDDELTIAQQQGKLHRNFQGYSTQSECDLLAFGASSISQIGPVYAQNVKTLDEYYEILDRDELPLLRGVELTDDDILRRSIIQALMCHFEVSLATVGSQNGIDASEYFAVELADLRSMAAAGLLTIDDDLHLRVLPAGRLLVRVVAMVFDRYLRTKREQAQYSRVI